MKRTYPWKLGGPWYRQESTGGPARRSARPILQKYASPDFVNRFLAEPQKSLKYNGEDFINRINIGSLYASISPADRQQGDGLKLFLDSHSRFYLVVCELYCQAPGYPAVSRDQVCEAGFVVRRSRLLISSVDRQKTSTLKAERDRLMVKIGKIQATQRSVHALGKKTGSVVMTPLRKLQDVGEKALQQKLAALRVEYAAQVDALAMLNGECVSEKWQVNTDLKKSGSWLRLVADEATPGNIKEEDEEIHPLYPLIPDPADENHTGRNRTFYFGVVPTSSGAFDTHGNPKLENGHSYSIRCFVRRHKEGCPRKSERADCPGEIVWSEATEGYRLAAFTDLDGCGHTPVNIQLPDLNDLKTKALRGPVGKGLNMRMISPDGSSLRAVQKSNDISMEEGNWQKLSGGGQICFFCIPLITIVAMFVLRLFLPIVVFVFQLWFLLKLKICIPPSLAVDAAMAADLDLYGPDFKAGLEAAIAADIKIGGALYDDLPALKDGIIKQLDTASIPVYLKNHLKSQLETNFNTAIETIIEMTPDFSKNPEAAEDPEKLSQATDGLEYFDRVEPA